ncbi:MAG TPA: YfiR family protein, partial [Bacteroidales bacterium]|nr:YfiR family protein [Bacteroidales bacterium]
MGKSSKYNRCIILVILILPFSGIFCQDNSEVGEEEIRASILYYICQYIEWPKEKIADEFSFGVMSDMPDFSRELSLIAKAEKSINGKPINIEQYRVDNLDSDLEVLIVSPDHYDEVEEIFSFCQHNSILLVTDEFDDRLYTMINFFYNQNNEAVNFEVNKQNLILSGLDYKEDILIYGGSFIDVRELYHATQERLQQESI